MRDEAIYQYATSRECCVCGEMFLPRFKSSKSCSPACTTALRRIVASKPRRKWGKVEAECDYCGKTFQAFRSEIGRRFCSRECWYASEPPSPALRPGVADKIAAAKTKHGKSTGRRQRQLENAGCTLAAKGETACRNCGSSETLQLHHAIPRSMWKDGVTEPLNCVALCVRCHMGWHHQRTGIPRSIFTAAEWDCISNAPLLGQNVEAWLERRYPRSIETVARDLCGVDGCNNFAYRQPGPVCRRHYDERVRERKRKEVAA